MRHNTAKWLGSLLAFVVLAAGCGALRQNAAERKADEARLATTIQQQLGERHFAFVPEYMSPTRGAGRHIGGESYSLVVDGDQVKSHLPYQGVAYNIPYGGGKALNFEAAIGEFSELAGKSDRRVFEFTSDNGEDVVTFRLTVFDNGNANLDVRSRNREQINFRGAIDPDFFAKAAE